MVPEIGADGYPHHAPSGTPVLLDGVRCTTVGRVLMDMLAVDVRPVPVAQIGSNVTLWGRAPSDERDGAMLAIDEVAHADGPRLL